jgi:cysteine desulfurase/selenocysteine lyase
MSTSDQDQAAGFAERLPALPVDETSLVGLLPDAAMLSRMANEFFRAQPGQGSPTTVAPLMPNAQELTPTFETRLPQFGMPLPSVPAIPSAGKVPVALDVSGLSSAPTELSPYMMGPAASGPAAPRTASPSGRDPRTN